MKLFKPRAPKVADASQLAAHFARAMSAPAAPRLPVELEDAITRVKQELVALRAKVAAADGVPSTGAIERDLAETQTDRDAAFKTLESKRAQCRAGLIEITELTADNARFDALVSRIRSLQTCLRARQEADAARAEIDRVLHEVV